jgi:hypothetical protein
LDSAATTGSLKEGTVLRASYELQFITVNSSKSTRIPSGKLRSSVSPKFSTFSLLSFLSFYVSPTIYVATYPVLMMWKFAPPLLSPWFVSSRVLNKMIQSRHFISGHQSGVTQGDIHSTCIAVSGVLTSPLLPLAFFTLLPLKVCHTFRDKCSVKQTCCSRVEIIQFGSPGLKFCSGARQHNPFPSRLWQRRCSSQVSHIKTHHNCPQRNSWVCGHVYVWDRYFHISRHMFYVFLMLLSNEHFSSALCCSPRDLIFFHLW